MLLAPHRVHPTPLSRARLRCLGCLLFACLLVFFRTGVWVVYSSPACLPFPRTLGLGGSLSPLSSPLLIPDPLSRAELYTGSALSTPRQGCVPCLTPCLKRVLRRALSPAALCTSLAAQLHISICSILPKRKALPSSPPPPFPPLRLPSELDLKAVSSSLTANSLCATHPPISPSPLSPSDAWLQIFYNPS